jgi:threonine/homoserine/homoserine lactone efflux protein
MEELHAILVPGIAGLIGGFAASVPVGPINVTILNEGARRGFRWGLLIGLGAVTMELIYCAIAFAGFSTVFDSRLVRATLELLSFPVLLYLGIKYLFLHDIPRNPRSARQLEEKLHPHSAFMTGFVRVLGNPTVMLFWMAMAATFSAHAWVEDTPLSKIACIVGIGVGVTAWFVALSYAVSLGHRRLSTNTLIRLSHASGVILLIVALIIGVRIILLLAEHRRSRAVPVAESRPAVRSGSPVIRVPGYRHDRGPGKEPATGQGYASTVASA